MVFWKLLGLVALCTHSSVICAQLTVDSSQVGTARNVFVGSIGYNYPYPWVMFQLDGVRSNPRQACITNGWAIRIDTPHGRAMYAALLTAISTGSRIQVYNNANSSTVCLPALHGAEDSYTSVDYILVVRQ